MWPQVDGPTLMHTWAALMGLLASETERRRMWLKGVFMRDAGDTGGSEGVNMIMFTVYVHGILEE